MLAAGYGLIASLDPARGESYRQIVAGVGLEPFVTRDGDEACAALGRRGAPGLLVTDLSLPRSDGFRLLGALRRVASAEVTPAIVLSAFAELRHAAERRRGELGIAAILPPHAGLHVVQRAVKRALEREHGLLPDDGPDATRPRAAAPHGLRWRLEAAVLERLLGEVVRDLGVPAGFVALATGEAPEIVARTGRRDVPPEAARLAAAVFAAGDLIVVPDVAGHPMVGKLAGPPAYAAYAAAPIATSHGELVAVLVVADTAPPSLGPVELEELTLAARRFAAAIELTADAAPAVTAPLAGEVSGGGWRAYPPVASLAAGRAMLGPGTPSSLLGAVLANLDSGVGLVDGRGVLLAGNAALAELADLPVERLTGLPRATLVDALAELAPDPAAARRVLRVGAGAYACREELELARPRRRVVRWVARPLRLGDGVGQMELFQDITAEVDLARERELLARTDWLTGLVNRRGGEEAIAREVARSRRLGSSLCFALFDIDRFKLVNDLHGHPVGDEVLREVARVLLGAVRGSDLAVRWGGDELLVVLPAVPESGARVFAERVRKRIAELDMPGLPRVSVSCGVAELGKFEEVATAVIRADTRLYEAKGQGRNRVR